MKRGRVESQPTVTMEQVPARDAEDRRAWAYTLVLKTAARVEEEVKLGHGHDTNKEEQR